MTILESGTNYLHCLDQPAKAATWDIKQDRGNCGGNPGKVA